MLSWLPTSSDRRVKKYRRQAGRVDQKSATLAPIDLALAMAGLRRSSEASPLQGKVLSEEARREEVFALVKAAAVRHLGLSAYPVQVMGALAMADGRIAEMRTGEGKTLVAAFTAALWALEGRGVHVVTANNYLASRDAATLAPVFKALGLSVGVVTPQQALDEKRAAYAADITYGTSSEFGFDYLRDQMAPRREDQVQRGRAFALVDEVDSLLIDEARTPLVISGDAEETPDVYVRVQNFMGGLIRQETEYGPGDFWLDEKERQVMLSNQGHDRVEDLLVKAGLLPPEENLYDPSHIALLHHVDVALRANSLLKRDVDYVVQNGEVLIVDAFTGRVQPGHRWDNGLHQAVEVKEGLAPAVETRTLASITIQHYFRGYETLAGMTGTAATEAAEFGEIYGLEVVTIPTHRPMIRQDFPDVLCVTRRDKLGRIVDEVAQCHLKGRPVLLGTPSVVASEEMAGLLQAAGLPFEMLNAKNHEREAAIIARAGEPGAITLATSMAGRGTDILLGGSPDRSSEESFRRWEANHAQVLALGGLHVIGTERQESRRVDNQLRGRAGRQGDPGSSRFYLSLEDDLLRIFAAGWAHGLLSLMGVREGNTIENARISKQVERAQRLIEGQNYDARKFLIDYDQVIQEQRSHVYAQRQALLDACPDSADAKETAWSTMLEGLPDAKHADAWTGWSLGGGGDDLPISLPEESDARLEAIHQAFEDRWQTQVHVWKEKWPERVRHVLLRSLDHEWRQHMDRLILLRRSVQLRAHAQQQPLQEYKREAHVLFVDMLAQIKRQAVRAWLGYPTEAEDAVRSLPAPDTSLPARKPQGNTPVREPYDSQSGLTWDPTPVVGRNALCPCGSGLRYKHCHGSHQARAQAS